MTQPKLKQLHKLLVEFHADLNDGTIFNDPPETNDPQQYGAEVVALVYRWVKQFHRLKIS